MRPETAGAQRTHELITAAKAGSVEAWSELDSRFRESLKLFLRGRIPPRARRQFETDDVLQSGLLQAFRELDQYQYRGRGSFYSWLVTILQNRLRSRVRRINALCRDVDREQGTKGFLSRPDSRWIGASPSEIAGTAERQAQLLEAISELDEELREVLAMHFFDRSPIATIAKELDVSARTIGRRLTRALEELGKRVR